MPEPIDEKVRALVVELAEHAPPPPAFDDVQNRVASLDEPHRSPVLIAGAVAAGLALLVGTLVLVRRDDRSERVRVGPPTTTTTAAANRPLRLSAEFLPPGFVAQPDGIPGVSITARKATDTDSMVIAVQWVGPEGSILAPDLVQASSFVRGALTQPEFAYIFLGISSSKDAPPQRPDGERRLIGHRSVVVTRSSVPAAVGGGSSLAAYWQERGHHVMIVATGITDADLEAFIRGLHPV